MSNKNFSKRDQKSSVVPFNTKRKTLKPKGDGSTNLRKLKIGNKAIVSPHLCHWSDNPMKATQYKKMCVLSLL